MPLKVKKRHVKCHKTQITISKNVQKKLALLLSCPQTVLVLLTQMSSLLMAFFFWHFQG